MSTKRRNLGGRPSNRERIEEQQAEIRNLRQLLHHRRVNDETWRLVNKWLTLSIELDDASSPLRASVWEGTGHGVEAPVFPGVTVVENRLVHAGSYAASLAKWLQVMIRRDIEAVEARLIGREPPPKPRPPRRETSYQENPITNNANA